MNSLHKISLIIFLFFISLQLYSQTETDEHSFINFNEGVGFLAPDSIFGMNIRFRMQNRLNAIIDNDDVSYEATVRRLRLRFDGFVLNPNLSYYLQLSFSRSDQDWDDTHTPNVIRDAMVYYRFNKNFYLGFGQGKLPGNRQRVTSSGSLQFADRSIANATFNIDRDFGIFSYFSNRLFNNFHYDIKFAISTGEGRNVQRTNNGLAYTARIELLPLGQFTKKGDYFEGDLVREEKPKLSLASSYSFNNKAIRTGGQRGLPLYSERDIKTYFIDGIFKYKGFCLISEFHLREAQNPITTDGSQTAYIFTGQGFNNQISYLLKNYFELAARHSMVMPDKKIKSMVPFNQEAYTLGLTKYILEHKTKVQLNLIYNKKSNSNFIDDSWNILFQVEIGI